MFRNKTAWFSSSVNQDIRLLWVSERGQVSDWIAADYLFSSDASCPDTRRVFKSAAYAKDRVTVFHSSCLFACEKRQSMDSVMAGHYILPPTCVQKEVKEITGHFIWEQEDSHKRTQEGRDCENKIKIMDSYNRTMTSPRKDEFPCCSNQHYPVNNMITGYPPVNSMKRYCGELHDFLPGHSGFSVTRVYSENEV